MGRKSRLKRERKNALTGLIRLASDFDGPFRKKSEADFKRNKSRLRDLFTSFNAEDVAVALGISSLWMPNISSQVKHHLAMRIFVSLELSCFNGSNRLDKFIEFSKFVSRVHELLPDMPYMEDFIPESDWGEIKIHSGGEFKCIFYGGSVERIPDYIEAFRLVNVADPVALRDMDFAIKLQNEVIRKVRREIIGSAEDISLGHMEVPTEEFWFECKNALSNSCIELVEVINTISAKLKIELGEMKELISLSSFCDDFMTGKSLPAIIVNINGKMFPLSIRDATHTVIDIWDDNREIKKNSSELTYHVAKYLEERMGHNVLCGPLVLTSCTETIPHRISAVLKTNKKFYFIVTLDVQALPLLEKLEIDIRRILASGKSWVLKSENRHEAVQFRRKDGSLPSTSEIDIIVVLSRVTTQIMALKLPVSTAQIMSLPDFVTIFDSLDNSEELDRFRAYADSNHAAMGVLIGLTDVFASFRDSHSLLIDGAIEPTFISIDPHWGSNWRFQQLKEFWDVAPAQFPDGTLAWRIDSNGHGLHRLISKGTPTLAWSTEVKNCTIQIMLNALSQDLDAQDGQILELFVHCLADVISQFKDIIEDFTPFLGKHIVVHCKAGGKQIIANETSEEVERVIDSAILSSWVIQDKTDENELLISVEVDLAKARNEFMTATDASFEVECLIQFLGGLASILKCKIEERLIQEIKLDSTKRKRFSLKKVERTSDVPDFINPKIPSPEHYKIARRDLAVILKAQGALPGRYELAEAKSIIDFSRDSMRLKIHQRIGSLDRRSLLRFCIEQHDALTTEYLRQKFRIKQSLEHDVVFDRAESMAEAYDKFVRVSKNYRYLIECCLSLPKMKSDDVRESEIVQIIASIDWLLVLYEASDVLHNGIDVAGLELDHMYIPKVFYAHGRKESERQFTLELAKARLGIDLLQEDEVNFEKERGGEWESLDQAFRTDLGFSFTQLVQSFLVLSRWKETGGDSELRLAYQATTDSIVSKLIKLIDHMTTSIASIIVNFMTLDSTMIRRLQGKDIDESDVPVWEHVKRGNRYTIRPLVEIDEGILAWGAAAAERASKNWIGSITNGYIPADFEWHHVKLEVRKIKAGLERQLETQAFKICSRATEHIRQGVDFMRSFRNEAFEDVGDYDVLAYWPNTNRWLSAECKYNQPPFCLKDARRLRDRIFGTDIDRGQFKAIERRRRFLAENVDKLREILGWPEPEQGIEISFDEIYVSRDIYWWMRNPPYQVPTKFVRIDALDVWLRECNLLL